MNTPAHPDTWAVQVRLFGALREQAGWGARPIRLSAGSCTAAELWRQLALVELHCPDSGPGSLPPSIRVAINLSFAAPDTPLRPGDEVAFLPPITGG